MNDIKREMKTRARLARGLVTALMSDVDYICSDVDNYDVICMASSIRETHDTVQRLVDNLTELEYLLYLIRREESR